METAEAITTINNEIRYINDLLMKYVPDGREKSLVKTKLDEAALWLRKMEETS